MDQYTESYILMATTLRAKMDLSLNIGGFLWVLYHIPSADAELWRCQREVFPRGSVQVITITDHMHPEQEQP